MNPKAQALEELLALINQGVASQVLGIKRNPTGSGDEERPREEAAEVSVETELDPSALAKLQALMAEE